MSSQEEKIFGMNKNSVIAVASALIFLLAVAMMVYYIYDGVTNAWTGSNVIGTILASVIALIFVSFAANYGFIKGKQIAETGKKYLKEEFKEIAKRNQLDKFFAAKLKQEEAKALENARQEAIEALKKEKLKNANKQVQEKPTEKNSMVDKAKIENPEAEKIAKENELLKTLSEPEKKILPALSAKEKNLLLEQKQAKK